MAVNQQIQKIFILRIAVAVHGLIHNAFVKINFTISFFLRSREVASDAGNQFTSPLTAEGQDIMALVKEMFATRLFCLYRINCFTSFAGYQKHIIIHRTI
jgi:hypothetical protein